MKHLTPLVFFLAIGLLFLPGSLLRAQAPPKNYAQQIAAMTAHCNLLLGSDSSVAENYPEALAYAQKALQSCKPGDSRSRGLFALFAGSAAYNTLNFDSALVYFSLAYRESIKAGAADQVSWASAALIPLYQQRQDYNAADTFRAKLQSIVDTTHDRRSLAKGYYGLGNYYYSKSYYTTAQDYILKGLETGKRLVDTARDNRIRKEYALNYYLLYKIYSNTQLYAKALDALKKGSLYMHASPQVTMRYYAAFTDAYTASGNLRNLDSALLYYNLLKELPGPRGITSESVTSSLNIGQYYLDAGQYTAALPFINRSDSLATSSKSPFLIHQVQHLAGKYAYYTGHYDQAITLLKQSSIVSQNVNKGNYAECLHYLALAYKAKGNAPQALAYYELFDAVKDTLNREQTDRNFADLDIRYRTREKEQEIKTLSIGNRITVLELRNANRLKLLLGAGVAALALILVLLYRIYRNKSRLNQVLNERNRELDQLNSKLAEANESKARLFGIFSHDLRSPLNKIAQFLRLQKAQPGLFSPQASTAYHEKFVQSTDNLLNTMEDLLIWSKSQMESFQPEFRPVALAGLARREIVLLGEQVEDKQVRLALNIPDSLYIRTDENFMSIILRNLLQNAVRYSAHAGSISLHATAQSLRITNTSGSGLDAPALNELLNRTGVNSNQFGLGLQIARDLAVRIGARLRFLQEREGQVTVQLDW
ncbi:sensor histidine kinase [Taibaiella chishuiensis]|uniref:histidine kinase n=1 Tax=Taibaiella chishuiensis TaxID=1434707 RepID=A0A2P8CT60_9BACT|nr:HAMP domain-containing sensor histidine kinase [Taibaiella chishuiensis]PSK88154.1 signal transduction histidine kinase [Taibaiella chishuiensis]